MFTFPHVYVFPLCTTPEFPVCSLCHHVDLSEAAIEVQDPHHSSREDSHSCHRRYADREADLPFGSHLNGLFKGLLFLSEHAERGRLITFGCNNFGQLGVKDFKKHQGVQVLVGPFGGKILTKVSCGEGFTIAATEGENCRIRVFVWSV